MKIFGKLLAAILVILIGFFIAYSILISININSLTVSKISRQSLKTVNKFNNLYYIMNKTLISTDSYEIVVDQFSNALELCDENIHLLTSMSDFSDPGITNI